MTNYDFYVSLEGNVYGASKQSYDLLDTQVAEYRVDVGNIVEGQSIAILNSEKVALSENFGAEPGDNNVSGDVGSFTIHNTAENAFVLIKTWETGWTNFYVSGYQSGGDVDPGEEVEYSCVDLPDWITNDGCVIFAWTWSGADVGSWHATAFISDTSLSFSHNGELNGFLLVRCVSGTTQPDWGIKSGDSVGRIYNKTADISCSAGVYEYSCPNWSAYNG